MLCPTFKTPVKSLLRQFDEYVNAHIDTALYITTRLKAFLVSPVADLLTAAIPGQLDDVIRARLVTALGKAVEALSIVESCKEITDINEKLGCFLQQLRLRDPLLQDAILQKLAGMLAGQLDGQRFKQRVYDLFTQAKFSISK